jgi:hypothetical protein
MSCTVGYPPNYYDQGMLVDFPLLPHTSEVQVYFPHDSLPDEEYLRVGVLEARGGEFTSYNQLIRQLQVQARERGVDAIQLMDKQVEASEYYGTSILSGIGIKYVKNLEYLTHFVKAQEIYLPYTSQLSADSGRWTTKVWLDFDRTPQTVEGNREYANFIRRYSLDYLLYEQGPRWRYALDEYGQIRMRVHTTGTGSPHLRVWFSYQTRHLPNFIRIKKYPEKEESTIWLAYDAEGRILKKRITLADGEVIDQILTYDVDGRHTKSEYYKVKDDQQLVPYLIVKHQFYSPDDVRERIVLKQ